MASKKIEVRNLNKMFRGRAPYDDFNYFKGKIATVFQTDRLIPWRSALDNAKIALEILGYSYDEQVKTAGEWLKKVGLTGFEGAYPGELSLQSQGAFQGAKQAALPKNRGAVFSIG